MLAYIAIVALISPQQYDTEKTIAQMRASRIKVDAALNAWIDCSDSRLKPLYSPTEPARDIASVVVRGCTKERESMHMALSESMGDSQSFKAAGEFADKQLQNMDTRLIDTYAERIMAFRRKQR